jgi:predicted nuclease with TOPRIM domain
MRKKFNTNQRTKEQILKEKQELEAKLKALGTEFEELSQSESEKEKQEAEKQIEVLLKEAYEKLDEAKRLADKHELSFDWDLSYGMGGSYDGEDGQWRSSSSNC